MPIGPAPDWQDISWMVGQYEGTPIIIAVDADGKIINVMQATYAGVLKPVACDAEGRIIMIPTDPADIWGNAISMGNAELAARLIGLGGFDRRGNVTFFDTFESGLNKGFSLTGGTGALVKLSSTSSRFGKTALKLTAGSDGSRFARYTWYTPYPIFSRCGLEACFTVDIATEYMQFILALYDGSSLHEARIRYNHVSSKIEYYDGVTGWQDLITGVVLVEDATAYHILKMVVDFTNNRYHRVLIDGWSWIVGDKEIYHPTSTTPKLFYSSIDHLGAIGGNPASYVDNVIFTQNEPS